MSTNSAIAVKTSAGYKTIYCHNDGYFSYMYPVLSDYYPTQERAEALVGFGDASFIDKLLYPAIGSNHSFDHPDRDTSIFYHRDRGEPWHENATRLLSREEALKWQYYVYIFEDDQWKAYVGGQEVADYTY